MFGNGNANADLMFIGGAPGDDEDKEGEPFVGASGEIFDALLSAVNLTRADVFTTNIVMCHPPLDRKTAGAERKACAERVYRQIYLVDPLIIVPVGAVAMEALMGKEWSGITVKHGQRGEIIIPGQYEKAVPYSAIPILCPAHILKKDTVDPATNKWRPQGPAEKTLDDLELITDIATQLREVYDQVRAKGASRGTQAKRQKETRKGRLKIVR